tara:strand:+ start:210 stop:338 length:129 start_codon:yes stop_codon:yes gene_type:complete
MVNFTQQPEVAAVVLLVLVEIHYYQARQTLLDLQELAELVLM